MPRVCWEEQLCVSGEFATINSRCTDFLRSTASSSFGPLRVILKDVPSFFVSWLRMDIPPSLVLIPLLLFAIRPSQLLRNKSGAVHKRDALDRQTVQQVNPVAVDERDSGQVQPELPLLNEESPASAR